MEVKKALDSLKETSKEAEKTSESIGEVGKQSEKTSESLGDVGNESEKTSDSISELGKESEKTSESIKEVGEESEKAGESIGGVGEESKETGSDVVSSFLKMSISVGGFVTAAVAAFKKMIELAESTREYRTEMGKLTTAFKTAGHTTESATKTYSELNSILGDTGQAIEAANHLALMCDSEERLEQLTEACIGVYAKFGASLPIEGLAEAANETAKVGALTGSLADALNWAGVSEDAFNEKLAACNSEGERAALIAETLTELYSESAKEYKETNKEIISAVKAQEKLNAATARWGEIFEPVAIAWYEFLAYISNVGADAFESMLDPTGGIAKEMAGISNTLDEARAKIKEFQDEIDALNDKPRSQWTNFDYDRYDYLMAALTEATTQYDELSRAAEEAAEATKQAAEEAARAAEEAADLAIVQKFDEATTQYVTDMTMLLDTFVNTYETIFSAVGGWFQPFEKASVSVTTSVGKMMEAMQSQIDFNTKYNANLEALKEYGLGGLADAFMTYGAEGAAYADTIVKAVEKAGGAATEEGQEIIRGFNDLNKQLTDSQSELSQTMTLLDGEFESAVKDLVDTYGEAIADLDKSSEAATAAKTTFNSFLQAMNKEIPGIVSAVKELGDDITEAIQEGIYEVKIPIDLIINPGSIPGAKTGLDYVPYDEYLVRLHKGEAVLTAEEATAWRAGKEYASSSDNTESTGSGCGITIIQNINAVEQTPVELASATAAYFEQARWSV